jgi:hypothetical protein
LQENWVNVFSHENYVMAEAGYDIVVDSQRNSYVCGQTGLLDGYDYDAVVFKISPEGETLWFHVFGDDSGDNNWGDTFDQAALDEAHGALYVAGDYCPPANPAHPQLYLVKLALSGEILREHQYGFGHGNGVVVDTQGYVYLSGVEDDQYCFLAKVDPDNGEALWTTRQDPNGGGSGAMEICLDDEGNIYQGGMSDWDWLVIKYNPAGGMEWFHQYDGGNDTPGGWGECAFYVQWAGDRLYAAGTVKEVQSNDMHIKCYDSDGTELWSYTYQGGYGFDVVEGLAVDSQGNAVITDGGNQITIVGVAQAELDSGDFLF